MSKKRSRLDHLASWLAADDGIPYEVQELFDVYEYYEQAKDIMEYESR